MVCLADITDMMRAVSIRKIGRLAGCRRNELARGQAFTGRSEVSLPGAKRRGHFAIAAVRVGVLMAALACSACSQNRNLRPLNDAALTTAQLPNQGPSVAPVDRQASANPLPVSTPTPAIFELCDFLEAPIPDDAWAPPPLQPSNPQSNDSAFSADPAVNDHPLTFREHFRDDLHELWPEILQDHRNYYSLENFGRLVVGFSVAPRWPTPMPTRKFTVGINATFAPAAAMILRMSPRNLAKGATCFPP